MAPNACGPKATENVAVCPAERENTRAGISGRRFLSNGFSRSTGGADVSTSTFGRCVTSSGLARVTSPSPPRPGYAQRPRQSETYVFIIDAHRQSKAQFFDGYLSNRRHQLVTGCIRVQAVIGKIAPQKTLAIHHGAEIIKVYEIVRSGICLQPAIQLQNLFR